jgi:hypothetical protein
MVLDRSIDEPFSEQELKQLGPIGAMMYEGFGRDVCDFNGVGPDQSDAVRTDFAQLLDALAVHFSQNDFLLGDRPCLADFALAGASKAHFICDPLPMSWLGKHSDMLHRYTSRFFADWPDEIPPWPTDDQIPASLDALLDYLQGSYYKSAPANIAAGLAGEKYYEFDCGSGTTRARSQKRLNVARLHVQDELTRAGADANEQVNAAFAGRGILEYYLG